MDGPRAREAAAARTDPEWAPSPWPLPGPQQWSLRVAAPVRTTGPEKPPLRAAVPCGHRPIAGALARRAAASRGRPRFGAGPMSGARAREAAAARSCQGACQCQRPAPRRGRQPIRAAVLGRLPPNEHRPYGRHPSPGSGGSARPHRMGTDHAAGAMAWEAAVRAAASGWVLAPWRGPGPGPRSGRFTRLPPVGRRRRSRRPVPASSRTARPSLPAVPRWLPAQWPAPGLWNQTLRAITAGGCRVHV